LVYNNENIQKNHMNYISKHLIDYINNKGLEIFNNKELKSNSTDLIQKILDL
jgi:hypothetical protein